MKKIKKAVTPFLVGMIFSLATLAVISLFIIGDNNHHKYQALQDRKEAFSTAHLLENQETTQLRTGVQKDIWMTQDDAVRHHIRIRSKGSSLSLIQSSSKFHLVENLSDIECWIQDKIDKDQKQQLRFFTAKEGTYAYPSHQFIANAIHMNFLSSPGSDLPESFRAEDSFLEGTAQKVNFQLGNKTPLFHAYHFSAQIDTKKGGIE